MSPTKTLCAAAGTTPEKVAKRARIQPSYLARCINRGCGYGTANVLTHLLGCDPMIFIWGYSHYNTHFSNHGHHGIAGSEAVDNPASRNSDFTPVPVSRVENSNAARRRHILKVV